MIMEDDADWDVLLKPMHMMLHFAKETNALQVANQEYRTPRQRLFAIATTLYERVIYSLGGHNFQNHALHLVQ